jgi:hypothetical protein
MNPTQETLNMMKGAQGNPLDLAKAGINVAQGLVGYSLESPAKLLYPVLTPLRNSIPRQGPVTGVTGTAENWKQITGINPARIRAGVSEGNRGAAISMTTQSKTSAYVGLGLENFVTFEADYAAKGFDDAKALATLQLLQSLMVEEEAIILNGNASLALGTTPTPTLTTATTGGTIAAGTTNFMYCVALTQWGFNAAGGVQVPVGSGATLSPTITRTNVDGSSDNFGGGLAAISAASSALTTTGSTSTVTGTVTPVKGAFGYAWFFGIAAGAGNAKLVAVTALPTVTITAVSAASYLANANGLSSDNSVCVLEFDGLITQCLSGGGYYRSMAGTTLTADGAGSVVEIDAMFKYFWDTWRLSPSTLWMDSQSIRDFSKKVASGSNPAFRINLQSGMNDQGNLVAGSLVTTILNKYALNGAQAVDVRIHPNMPVGTIYADLAVNPYPSANVPAPRRVRTRQEYYQLEWPLRTRKYEYGVYVDEFLQVYMPFGTGVITDILAG